MRFLLFIFVSLFSSLALAGPQSSFSFSQSTTISQALIVGDDAPSIEVAEWIKGKPAEEFKSGQVYVVEFWATWCKPCEVTIPHLTDLAKKHKDKVQIIGVSVWETPETQPKAIQAYVKEKGDTMAYTVARDQNDHMAEHWMMAARRATIPTAFIVNQDGKIAWIGHPLELDTPLQQVVDGKWDIKKARAEAQEQLQLLQKVNELNTQLEMAIILEEHELAIKTIDDLIKALPDRKTALLGLKAEIMIDFDEENAYPLIRALFAGDLSKLPDGLNQLAWAIVDPDKTRKSPDYNLARDMAKKACELTEFKDPMILDTYALTLFKSKDPKNAVKYQKLAIELAKKDPNIETEQIVQFTERLKEFEKAIDKTPL